MATATDGRWHPGIGDPTATGWITVAAYALACLLCWWCARRTVPGAERRFWWALAVVLLLLGINKQLDLQTWLTQFARDRALADGWYAHRQVMQVIFIAWLATVGAVLLRWLAARLGNLHRSTRLAAMGLLVLGVFVLMRAASFHHIDVLLSLNFSNVRVNAVLELSGIGVIIYAAGCYLRATQQLR